MSRDGLSNPGNLPSEWTPDSSKLLNDVVCESDDVIGELDVGVTSMADSIVLDTVVAHGELCTFFV